MKLKQLIVTAIATAGLTFAAQAAPAPYGGAAEQANSGAILVGGHGGHGGGHGGGHFGGGLGGGHFGGGSHFSGGGHFSAPRFSGGHYGGRHLGGGNWGGRSWSHRGGHWRGHGYRRGGYYYYGWGGGSCYGNCLAAGYSSSYCAVHSYDFCW
jgi:hypothetical protein